MGDDETRVGPVVYLCRLMLHLTYTHNRWHYLPFNGGPRICIGQQFALTEAGYTTVRLLQAFKSIENRDQSEYAEWVSTYSSVPIGTTD
jgi:cytochrome P450